MTQIVPETLSRDRLVRLAKPAPVNVPRDSTGAQFYSCGHVSTRIVGDDSHMVATRSRSSKQLMEPSQERGRVWWGRAG